MSLMKLSDESSFRVVGKWFAKNGFESGEDYIKKYKIDGQELQRCLSEPKKEMFGMNRAKTEELIVKLDDMGFQTSYLSDGSYESVEDYKAELSPNDHNNSDNNGYSDHLSCFEGESLKPPELPPRFFNPGRAYPGESKPIQADWKDKIKPVPLTDNDKFSEEDRYESPDGGISELRSQVMTQNLQNTKKPQIPILPKINNQYPRFQPDNFSSDEDDGLKYEIVINLESSAPPLPRQINANSKGQVPQKHVETPCRQPPLPPMMKPKQKAPPIQGFPKVDEEELIKIKLKPVTKPNKVDESLSIMTPGPDILKPAKINKPMNLTHDEELKPEQKSTNVSKKMENSNPPIKMAVLPPTYALKNNSESLEDKIWFQKIDRMKASKRLEAIRKDGAFIVRPGKDKINPYTLVVYVDGEIKNMHIRRRPDDKFALGSQKPNEETFDSIVNLIAHFCQQKIDVTTESGTRGVTLVNVSCLKK